MWFADSAGAIGQVSPGGQITEHTRGLRTGSSPVAVAAGPDGDMWFTDEGQMPAVGRVTAAGAIREFSAGVPTGSEPAAIAPAADGRLWFTDEGSAAAFGVVTVGTPAAQRAAPHLAAAPRPGAPAACTAGRFATWMGLQPSAAAFRFDGFRWLRNDTLLGGHRGQQFTPTRHDAGARLAVSRDRDLPAAAERHRGRHQPAAGGAGRAGTRPGDIGAPAHRLNACLRRLVHRGEQGGVGADERRALALDQRAGQAAALPHPPVRVAHRLGPERPRRAHRVRVGAVDVGIQRGQRIDQRPVIAVAVPSC